MKEGDIGADGLLQFNNQQMPGAGPSLACATERLPHANFGWSRLASRGAPEASLAFVPQGPAVHRL
jgi:hypothetical protein